MNFLDIDLTGLSVTFCGNYGDPIYHPDFIDLISVFKSRQCQTKIVTNGSYKSTTWWEKLCDHLAPDDSVIFSVDGTPENFTNYRVNADWPSIESGMKICVMKNINTVWKFIPFQYNQHQIHEAKTLANDIGIKEFTVSPSDRFDEDTMMFLPDASLQGKRKSRQDAWKQNVIGTVDPKCYTGKEYYISADGFFSPCCYVADHRFLYKTQFGKQKSDYSIRDNTLTQILSTAHVVKFYQQIPHEPPDVCSWNCPKTT